MEVSEAYNRTMFKPDALPDAELLLLFAREPDRAWDIFIKRYGDLIFTQLRGLGFDYDQAMDRFVYVCEKLSAENYRRLKTVRYAGDRGELTPWLRQVIKNLSINWAWSAEGRLRLFKPVTRLPPREQHIFELYFWKGLSPSEIYEQLRLEEKAELDFSAVLDALERIFSVLNQQDLWRLYSNLARRKGAVSLDEIQEETGKSWLKPAQIPKRRSRSERPRSIWHKQWLPFQRGRSWSSGSITRRGSALKRSRRFFISMSEKSKMPSSPVCVDCGANGNDAAQTSGRVC